MPDGVIDDRIVNSPCADPGRHVRFDDGGIADEVAKSPRRVPTSLYD